MLARVLAALALVPIATVVLVSPSPPAGAKSVRHPCPVRSSPASQQPSKRHPSRVDVLTSPRVSLFNYSTEDDEHSTVCNRRTRRRWIVDDELLIAGLPPGEARRRIKFAGWHAAWVWESPYDMDNDYTGIDLIDARDASGATVVTSLKLQSYTHYSRLILRHSSALAWSTTRGDVFACPTPLKHLPDRSDITAELASGYVVQLAHDNAKPASLRATPHGITWKEGQHTRHAKLP
jgi:hypothetical protein